MATFKLVSMPKDHFLHFYRYTLNIFLCYFDFDKRNINKLPYLCNNKDYYYLIKKAIV